MLGRPIAVSGLASGLFRVDPARPDRASGNHEVICHDRLHRVFLIVTISSKPQHVLRSISNHFNNMVDLSLAHPSRKVLLVVTTGSYSHARKSERNSLASWESLLLPNFKITNSPTTYY